MSTEQQSLPLQKTSTSTSSRLPCSTISFSTATNDLSIATRASEPSTTSVSISSDHLLYPKTTLSSSAVTDRPTIDPTQKHVATKHCDEKGGMNNEQFEIVNGFLHNGNNKRPVEKQTAHEREAQPKDSTGDIVPPDILDKDNNSFPCKVNNTLLKELVEVLPSSNTITVSSRQRQPSNALSQEYPPPPPRNRHVVDRLREGKDMFIYNPESENESEDDSNESVIGVIGEVQPPRHPAVAMDVDGDIEDNETKLGRSTNSVNYNNNVCDTIAEKGKRTTISKSDRKMDAAKRFKLFEVVDEDEHLRGTNPISTTVDFVQPQNIQEAITRNQNDTSDGIGNISATTMGNSTVNAACLKTFDFGSNKVSETENCLSSSVNIVPANLKTFDFGKVNETENNLSSSVNHTIVPDDQETDESSSDDDDDDDDDVIGCEHDALQKCWQCYLIWSSRQPLPESLIRKAREQGSCICHK